MNFLIKGNANLKGCLVERRKRLAVGLLQPGYLLNDRFRILRIVKAGGMGAVYEATDGHLDDAPCAIKEMLESHQGTDDEAFIRRKFEEERAILARLRHPGIPQVRDFFLLGAVSYIAMDFVQGANLEEELENYKVLSGRAYAAETLVQDVLQILDILSYLHNLTPPIIHRDIKPANLVREIKSGRVTLVDFGLARKISHERSQTGVGTLAYCSLEQVQGHAQTGSDIYSLGVTMQHLLTGVAPLPFATTTLLAIDPLQDPALGAIVDRACAQAVEARPDANTMACELREWVERKKTAQLGVPTSDLPVRTLLQPDQPMVSNAPKSPERPVVRPPIERSWFYAAVTLAVALPLGISLGQAWTKPLPEAARAPINASPVALSQEVAVAPQVITPDPPSSTPVSVVTEPPRAPVKPPVHISHSPGPVPAHSIAPELPRQPGPSADYPIQEAHIPAPPNPTPRLPEAENGGPTEELKLRDFQVTMDLPRSLEAVPEPERSGAGAHSRIWNFRSNGVAGFVSIMAGEGSIQAHLQTRKERGELVTRYHPTTFHEGADCYRIAQPGGGKMVLLLAQRENVYYSIRISLQGKQTVIDPLLDSLLASLRYP